MSRNIITVTVLAIALLAGSLLAQDDSAATPPAKAQEPTHKQILRKAIKTMTQLNGIAFRTTEAQNSAMTRRVRRQMGGMMPGGGDIDVRGTWSDGVLKASLNDDED